MSHTDLQCAGMGEDPEGNSGNLDRPKRQIEYVWNPPNTPHPATLDLEALMRDCRLTQTRRGGPGGQHRNKTSTAIVVEHLPTGIRGEAGERRSQVENRSVATKRLRENLAIQVRCKLSEGEAFEAEEILRNKYSVGSRMAISSKNWDYPGVVALILNDIEQRQGSVKEVAEQWSTSASQIVRILKQLPAAFLAANAIRDAYGLHQLR